MRGSDRVLYTTGIVQYSKGVVSMKDLNCKTIRELEYLYHKWFWYWVHGTFKGFDYEKQFGKAVPLYE